MNNTNRQNRQNHLTTIGILLVFLIIIAMCGAIATVVLNNDETVYSEPEHVHNYGDLVEKVDATLDADGHWAYYHCEECDKYFDSNKKEIDWGDLIIYGGHNYVYHERVEPTCTQNGKHEYYTCTDCDKKFNVNKQEVASEPQLNIAALKHDSDLDILNLPGRQLTILMGGRCVLSMFANAAEMWLKKTHLSQQKAQRGTRIVVLGLMSLRTI